MVYRNYKNGLEDATNPTNPAQSSSATAAGVFAGQVTALQINVALGDADPAVFPGGGSGIGDFLVDYPTCYPEPNDLPTVQKVLTDANMALSGAGNPTACSISELNHLVDLLNKSFDNCTVNPEASILRIPSLVQD